MLATAHLHRNLPAHQARRQQVARGAEFYVDVRQGLDLSLNPRDLFLEKRKHSRSRDNYLQPVQAFNLPRHTSRPRFHQFQSFQMFHGGWLGSFKGSRVQKFNDRLRGDKFNG